MARKRYEKPLNSLCASLQSIPMFVDCQASPPEHRSLRQESRRRPARTMAHFALPSDDPGTLSMGMTVACPPCMVDSYQAMESMRIAVPHPWGILAWRKGGGG